MMSTATSSRLTARFLSPTTSRDLWRKSVNVKSRSKRKSGAGNYQKWKGLIKMHYTLNHAKIKTGQFMAPIS